MGRSARTGGKLTRVTENRNTTTNKQFLLRLTDNERGELELLTEAVQKVMPNKKITMSRVLRASVFLQDEEHLEKLAASIAGNT